MICPRCENLKGAAFWYNIPGTRYLVPRYDILTRLPGMYHTSVIKIAAVLLFLLYYNNSRELVQATSIFRLTVTDLLFDHEPVTRRTGGGWNEHAAVPTGTQQVYSCVRVRVRYLVLVPGCFILVHNT